MLLHLNRNRLSKAPLPSVCGHIPSAPELGLPSDESRNRKNQVEACIGIRQGMYISLYQFYTIAQVMRGDLLVGKCKHKGVNI